MKEFDLESAKNGAPVCTRDGRPVRILCYDLKGSDYPIVACAERDNVEIVILCTADGHLLDNADINSFDLMMAPVKHEGWINVLNCEGEYVSSGVWSTEEEAADIGHGDKGYVTTIKIEWED